MRIAMLPFLFLCACGRAPSPPASTPAPPAENVCAPPAQAQPAARGERVGPVDPPALLQRLAQGGGVLGELSEDARQEIIDTAEWGPRGLTTFRATIAERELGEAGLKALFEALAIPPERVIKDAACVSRATCERRIGSWCVIANC